MTTVLLRAFWLLAAGNVAWVVFGEGDWTNAVTAGLIVAFSAMFADLADE